MVNSTTPEFEYHMDKARLPGLLVKLQNLVSQGEMNQVEKTIKEYNEIKMRIKLYEKSAK